MRTRVSIDKHRCQGHGRCYLIAPDVFEPEDDYGHSMLSVAADALADPEVREQVDNAARSCPESAITLS
jgi:ferredoxin